MLYKIFNDKFFIKTYGKELNLSNSIDEIFTNQKKTIEQCIANDNKKIQSIYIMKQIHSNNTFVAIEKEKFNLIKESDSLVTNKTGVLLCLLHADCVPVILIDEKNQIIGAAHAGWKGTISGIIENTINKMIELGSNTNHIFSWIGPCIRLNSYEVDSNFHDTWAQKKPDSKKYFTCLESEKQKYKFDLSGYIKKILRNNNIKNINDCMIDTYSSKNFFSYRYSIHNNLNKGLNLSVVAINSE